MHNSLFFLAASVWSVKVMYCRNQCPVNKITPLWHVVDKLPETNCGTCSCLQSGWETWHQSVIGSLSYDCPSSLPKKKIIVPYNSLACPKSSLYSFDQAYKKCINIYNMKHEKNVFIVHLFKHIEVNIVL